MSLKFRFVVVALNLRLLALLCISLAPAPAFAEGAAGSGSVAAAETPLGVGALVMGIIGYTSWPGGARMLEVCVSRSSADLSTISAAAQSGDAKQPVRVRAIEPEQAVPQDCDVVYFASLDITPLRSVLRALAPRPVLTIGQGLEFCSDGGIVCLQRMATQTRFEVNLDALSRSGLRINPQVLRIARPRAAIKS